MTDFSRREFLSQAGRWTFLGLGAAPALSLFISSCATTMTATSKITTTIGVKAGALDEEKAEAIQKEVTEAAKSFRDFTPEQEYYIGRAVGATILNQYRPYEEPEANLYLNLLGQTLAQFSELPETFNGYHFLILDADDINALSAPGGLIFVSRGLLRCCEHEDALAAVLAHEIGHVQYKHGLQAIRKSRITSAITTLAIKGVKGLGSETLAKLTETFEGSIRDITSTLINSGYSRGFEKTADKAAVDILDRAGYNPRGLIDMLKIMKKKLNPGGLDFAKTHPSPSWRIATLREYIVGYPRVEKPKARQDRFLKALADV